MPDIDELKLLEQLTGPGSPSSAIVITGNGDEAMTIRAMKAGALDTIEGPVRVPELVASVAHALDLSRDRNAQLARHAKAEACVAGLTTRQLDAVAMALAGHSCRNIAADRGVSQRTVENHRASTTGKTGARSLPAIGRLAPVAKPGKAA